MSSILKTIIRQDLYSLEEYAADRAQFRAEVMAHKKDRKVHVGPNATLYFEDRLTIQYQVQEMLRVERIFAKDEIQAELDTYNPLIPDGSNWKATMMLEYEDVGERTSALAQLIGVEDRVWVKVGNHDPVWATADEDLEREDESKTSSVHFVRFELTPDMIRDLKSGRHVGIGIEHENYLHKVDSIAEDVRASLIRDLD